MPRRLRLGMIGGGQGAFIGAVHRIASRLDDRYELVAGCLSSTPEKAHSSAKDIGLNPDRSYANFKIMAEKESSRVRQNINSHKLVKFCGAYTGYGFHEDGFKSGKQVADMINAEVII